jgi:hypothetical protein
LSHCKRTRKCYDDDADVVVTAATVRRITQRQRRLRTRHTSIICTHTVIRHRAPSPGRAAMAAPTRVRRRLRSPPTRLRGNVGHTPSLHTSRTIARQNEQFEISLIHSPAIADRPMRAPPPTDPARATPLCPSASPARNMTRASRAFGAYRRFNTSARLCDALHLRRQRRRVIARDTNQRTIACAHVTPSVTTNTIDHTTRTHARTAALARDAARVAGVGDKHELVDSEHRHSCARTRDCVTQTRTQTLTPVAPPSSCASFITIACVLHTVNT